MSKFNVFHHNLSTCAPSLQISNYGSILLILTSTFDILSSSFLTAPSSFVKQGSCANLASLPIVRGQLDILVKRKTQIIGCTIYCLVYFTVLWWLWTTVCGERIVRMFLPSQEVNKGRFCGEWVGWHKGRFCGGLADLAKWSKSRERTADKTKQITMVQLMATITSSLLRLWAQISWLAQTGNKPIWSGSVI